LQKIKTLEDAIFYKSVKAFLETILYQPAVFHQSGSYPTHWTNDRKLWDRNTCKSKSRDL